MKFADLLSLLMMLACVTHAAIAQNVSRSDDSRIVGGYATFIRYHKHLVQLRYVNDWYCGGSLVTRQHVVTASHCVENDPMSPRRWSIKAASTYLSTAGVVRQVVRIWMHPKYDGYYYDFDVAVLKLFSPVNSALAKPIPLATKRVQAGQFVNVAGWGLVGESSYSSNQLRAVHVRVVAKTRCNAMYNGDVTGRMMCAASPGKDACQGDSGGPLVKDGKLCGIVSWGYGCARPNAPGVYADVVTLLSFIRSKLKL